MKDLHEKVKAAIVESLQDPEGVGSDLEWAVPIDSTWVMVQGNLDVEHLASLVIEVIEEDKSFNPLEDVSRVTLVDDQGIAYETYNAKEVMTSVQDNGRTLKVFLKIGRYG